MHTYSCDEYARTGGNGHRDQAYYEYAGSHRGARHDYLLINETSEAGRDPLFLLCNVQRRAEIGRNRYYSADHGFTLS